jgi:hypothetical protein
MIMGTDVRASRLCSRYPDVHKVGGVAVGAQNPLAFGLLPLNGLSPFWGLLLNVWVELGALRLREREQFSDDRLGTPPIDLGPPSAVACRSCASTRSCA